MKDWYLLYKTTNNLTGEFYIGVHSTDNILDGYLGSGVLIQESIDRYGRQNFTREILDVFDNSQEMFQAEAEIVTQELLENPLCLNEALGGNQKVAVSSASPKRMAKGTVPVRAGGKIIRVPKEEYDQGLWESMHKGRPRTEETKRKISESKKGRSVPPMYWVNKDGVVTRVLKEKLQEYLDSGWARGRNPVQI